jgi:hypothetical protein
MIHSYSQGGKTYAVIEEEDGIVVEHQRGDRIFGHFDDEKDFWDDMDAWRATWPADAVAGPSVPVPEIHPILKKYFWTHLSNIRMAPNDEDIRQEKLEYECCSKSYAFDDSAVWGLQESRDRLEYFDKILNGELPYYPVMTGETKTYVIHNGSTLAIFHNIDKNLLYVYCEDGEFRTADELGITVNSKFVRRREFWNGILQPITSATD